MENLLISACLLGVSCRYDGKSKPHKDIEELKKKYNLIPICPEIYGGLETPRVPSERIKDKVIMKNGRDVTENYNRGRDESYKLVLLFNCKKALLKEKSPSCGKGKIYDGTFTGALTDGNGVTAEFFIKNGIEVFGESEISKLL